MRKEYKTGVKKTKKVGKKWVEKNGGKNYCSKHVVVKISGGKKKNLKKIEKKMVVKKVVVKKLQKIGNKMVVKKSGGHIPTNDLYLHLS